MKYLFPFFWGEFILTLAASSQERNAWGLGVGAGELP